jgi:cell division protease FtsH
MLTAHADPVRKVSIIPRGMALGATLAAPADDRFNHDESYLLARIDVALGGRAAEELVFGDVTTGAESDLEQLTEIARQMVGRWGMSRAIGPVVVFPSAAHGPIFPGANGTSEQTHRTVDAEVRRIVETAHQEVTALLRQHRAKLDALAEALMEQETLDEEDAYGAAGIERPTAGNVVAVPAR